MAVDLKPDVCRLTWTANSECRGPALESGRVALESGRARPGSQGGPGPGVREGLGSWSQGGPGPLLLTTFPRRF